LGGVHDKALSRLFPQNGWTWSYKEEMRHFARCVRSGEAFRSPAADAMEDVRTLEAIYRMHVEAAG
jgi:predicted dehydrogenase